MAQLLLKSPIVTSSRGSWPCHSISWMCHSPSWPHHSTLWFHRGIFWPWHLQAVSLCFLVMLWQLLKKSWHLLATPWHLPDTSWPLLAPPSTGSSLPCLEALSSLSLPGLSPFQPPQEPTGWEKPGIIPRTVGGEVLPPLPSSPLSIPYNVASFPSHPARLVETPLPTQPPRKAILELLFFFFPLSLSRLFF